MPVITDSGVVGLITGTRPGRPSDVDARPAEPRRRLRRAHPRPRHGARRGLGDLRFRLRLREESIEEGDLLLTSGIGGVYPKGLRVGRIEKIDRKTSGLILGAKVVPAVDFSAARAGVRDPRTAPDPRGTRFLGCGRGALARAAQPGPVQEVAPPAPPVPSPTLPAAEPPQAALPEAALAPSPPPAPEAPRCGAGEARGGRLALLLGQVLARLILPAAIRPDLVLIFAARDGAARGRHPGAGPGLRGGLRDGRALGLAARALRAALRDGLRATRRLERALYLRAAGLGLSTRAATRSPTGCCSAWRSGSSRPGAVGSRRSSCSAPQARPSRPRSPRRRSFRVPPTAQRIGPPGRLAGPRASGPASATVNRLGATSAPSATAPSNAPYLRRAARRRRLDASG